jgi:biotin carboxyl carrier protein
MKKYRFTIHGNKYDVTILNVDENLIDMEVNGSAYQVEVDKSIQPVKTPRLVRSKAVPSTELTPLGGTATAGKIATGKAGGTIRSPLPGAIISIHVKPGDKVAIGQKLMVLEAMKMENNIDSDREGTVVAVPVAPGQQVMEGDVLLEMGG